MKANELRIGNLIDRSDYICKVLEISNDGIISEPLQYIGERFVNIEVKSIPLTEEWLLRFGFNSNGYGEFDLNGICLDKEYTEKNEWILYLEGESVKPINSKNEYVCRIYPPIDLKYVHQLQNLYFALTGEELELK